MESIEQIIGYHCAPAIRGIKVANLVALPQHLGAKMVEKTNEYNDKFNQKVNVCLRTICDNLRC